MPAVTIAAIVIFVGFAIYNQVTGITDNTLSKPEREAGVVLNEASASAATLEPTMTYPPLPSSTNEVEITQGDTSISISVDSQVSDDKTLRPQIIYPGATQVTESVYHTNDSGEEVYNWYKEELGRRSFAIRNNVKTKANDQFKAVVQAESENSSIKISIDQANSNAKTTITLE